MGGVRNTSPNITSEEFVKAEEVLFRLIQAESVAGRERSNLKGVQVFQDENGILRMKSRVVDSEETREYSYPTILPAKHLIVERMIEQAHLEHKHAGVQTLKDYERKGLDSKGEKNITFGYPEVPGLPTVQIQST